MKTFTITTVSALALAGCSLVATPVSDLPQRTFGMGFTPTISKDGEHGFTYGVSSAVDPATSQEEAAVHEDLIAQAVGKRHFCLKGYQVLETKTEPSLYGKGFVTSYRAKCKP